MAFAQFWAAYPRKQSKQDAGRAFAKLAPDADLVVVLLAAIERQKTWPQWQHEEGAFIPYPATWLNGRKWEDEATTPATAMLTPRGQTAKAATDEWLRLHEANPSAPERLKLA